MRKISFAVLAAALLAPGVASARVRPWAASQPLEKITGLNVPADWQDRAVFQSQFEVAAEDLPRFFDWRFYANRLTPVNRQANNDCWAQGTVGVLESLMKIAYGIDTKMSVQEIISCSGDGSAANGGYFAHDYHQKHGGVSETAFPYVGRDVRCKSGLRAEQYLSQWGYVGARGRSPSVTEIKQAILEHGPVGATITANRALQRFTGDGVFTGCSNGGTNHIVVIVGWNDDEGSKGVWFMRNSWGTSHGQDGYAKIPFGCSRLGEQATWADLKVPGVGYVKAIDM